MASGIAKCKHCSAVAILLHSMYSRCYSKIETAEKAPVLQDSGVKLLLLITVS